MFALKGYISVADVANLIFRQLAEMETNRGANLETLQEGANSGAREFLYAQDFGWVIAPSGSIFKVGRRFLTETDEATGQPTCFDLFDGLVGRSAWPDYHKIKKRLTFLGSAMLVAFVSALALTYFASGDVVEMRSFGLSIWLPPLILLFAVTVSISCMPFSAMFEWYSYQRLKALSDWRGYAVCFDEAVVHDFLRTLAQRAEETQTDEAMLAEAAVSREILAAYRSGKVFSKAEFQTLKTAQGMPVRSFLRAWDKAREIQPELGKPGKKRRGH